jgi:hypothetical protein
LKRTLAPVLVLTIGAFSPAWTDELSRERQLEIIENYMYVTGQTTQLPTKALDEVSEFPEELPVKCGTPAVLDFVFNRDKLDPGLLRALGVRVVPRPTYSDERTYNSPDNLFKIHYTTTGVHAVYRAGDDRDGDGVPNYVEDMAFFLESVYTHIIDTLGYPPPPVDSFYESGGDEKYDVYISDIGGSVYGYTYPDEYAVDDTNYTRATSFIELENDYQEMPTYKNRPLDAVRVTCAHEFFHAVQFGIDVSEFEVDTIVVGQETTYFARRYWMEMSAVWMEEEIYDNINDYYAYLPYFFNYPRVSIQQFKSTIADFHPYASVVFPIFLSEKFGRDIIKDIWLRCAEWRGPNFLIATEMAIDSITGDTLGLGLPTAFRDFAQWNYFTGDRVCFAPDDVGYSEKEWYPAIPDTIITLLDDTNLVIVNHTEYPLLVLGNENPYWPEHNSAAYVRLNHMRAVKTDPVGYDTTFWLCRGWDSLSLCIDSVQVTVSIDTFFSIYVFLGDPDSPAPPQPWGLNVVFQLDSIPDSFIVDQFFLPYVDAAGVPSILKIIEPNQYRSVTMIVSPASYVREAYKPPYDYTFAYYVPELLDSARIDTPIIIDSEFVDIPASVLAPYPNPAVVADMGESPLKFRFQIPTDSFSNCIYAKPSFTVDIFNVAGEFVSGFTSITPHFCGKQVEFTADWDMKNERGKEVASGVYIAVGRVFSSAKKDQLLAEDKVKVAIIR